MLEWRVDPDDRARHTGALTSEGLDQRLVVVCAHGYSSSLAAATLQDLGFTHATDVVGGFEAWKERGLPVHPAPEVDADTVPGMGPPDA